MRSRKDKTVKGPKNRAIIAIILAHLGWLTAPADAHMSSPASNADCPVILTDMNAAVAPNQPEIQPGSTVGIINALCDVKLRIVGCLFSPTEISIACDANGDGVAELIIPLKDVTLVNGLLVEATLPALEPQLPGTAFPLACCGGIAGITLTRRVGSGDDNAFGPFVESQTCPIDLGIRAPVVISATPSDGDCSVGQNILIPGSCFLLANGKPNVTSVFAVEEDNPTNVIQASAVVILNTNLIDAFFEFGQLSEGKTFLIFASGPNGTSRNLTALPPQAPQNCPLGNEQGVKVTFTCRTGSNGPTLNDPPPPPRPVIHNCAIKRSPAGTLSLRIDGFLFREGQTVTINGVPARKLKFKNPQDGNPPFFTTILAKGGVCKQLPGTIIVFDLSGAFGNPFFCGSTCPN
ncbi:MAG TPA: hypothetical protein VLU47_11805 [Blastocatellia bacterium]|nr:hypothetical protein [Blastocatellia bacterium]